MKLYSTILKEAYSEQVILKSRFICSMKPVSSKEEAELFISEIRKKYKDATHNVPSFVLGEKMEIVWASDDSEPQGTAGAPSLEVLTRNGLTNIVCVVTRYFGGTKLGTGGLVKAYQSSVKLALDNSIICEATEMHVSQYMVDYNTYQKIEKMREKPFNVIEKEFQNEVKITVISLKERIKESQEIIENLSNGKAKLLSEEDKIINVPILEKI